MTVYSVALDSATERFYQNVAACAGLPLERVLADTLFKLAGELSLEALSARPGERERTT